MASAALVLPSLVRRGHFLNFGGGALIAGGGVLGGGSFFGGKVTTLFGNIGGLVQFNRASVNYFHTSSVDLRKAHRQFKPRRTHPRHVWAKKRRERNDQELTEDNQAFINKIIYDRHGPLYNKESFSASPYVSPLKNVIDERGEWAPNSIRTGLIGRKIGIYPMWTQDGKSILTTLIQIIDNHVIKYIPPEVVKANYPGRYKREDTALLLVGAESTDPQRFTKEYLGLFEESGLPPKNKIARFMITPNAKIQPGTPLYATHFQVGQKVEIFGKTVDHGFQGVMRRWNFKGMPATHGVTKSHRRGGNIGGAKAKVWPGTKMPGHMGNHWRKLVAQEIIRINTKYNVIYIRGGACMGDVGSFVTIHDTFLRKPKKPFDSSVLPFPTHYPDENEETIQEEYYAPNIFNFSDQSIVFDENR